MRVLVTGGFGFAASHLVKQLLQQEQEVVSIVRCAGSGQENLWPSDQLRIEPVDLLNRPGLIRVFRDTRPDRIYHLAAKSSPSESMKDPLHTYDVNFQGTLNVFSAWRELQLDCRILYVSSAEVYGQPCPEWLPLREEAPLRPVTPYGGSKAAAEMLAVQFFEGYGLPIVRVRPFNHTGPGQSSNYVCSSFARQVAEIDAGLREPIVAVGNLKVLRDFSDVRDIVRGYQLILEKGKPGDVYQLCAGRGVSVESILQRLIALASRSIEVVVDRARTRNRDMPEFWGDPAKSRAAGWEPSFPLETTLRDLKSYWDQVVHSSVDPQPREETIAKRREN